MSEEEQEAIRSAKCEIETEKEVGCIFAKWLDIKELEIILNLVDKLQKENEELKEHLLRIKNYLR